MKSIRTKITLTYVALSFLIVLSLGLASSIVIEDYFTRRLIRTLGLAADRIAYALRLSTSTSPESQKETLDRLARLENLRITLVHVNGEVILDSEIPLGRLGEVENHLERPEILEAMRKPLGTHIRRSATVDRDFLYVAKKVRPPALSGLMPDGGFMRVSVPFEEVQEIVTAIRWSIGLAGVGVLVVIIGVSALVSRKVTRPMQEIAEAAQDIRRGNLDRRIQVTSRDEIGQVAQAVNELVEKLKADLVQLRKLERVRTEFLANVSHELRTPIFSLQGFLETLLGGAIDDRSVNRTFVQKAYGHAERLNALLTDLIDIARIESGEMKMSFRYFRLNEFLRSATEDVQEEAAQFQIDVQVQSTVGDDLEVYGDRDRLRQALNNLLQNAVRYNTPGGKVIIRTALEDRSLRVAVADTGIGIPSEHLPRIFERFYRVDQDRSREVGGTGLGLAIVKHIVEAHGSRVTAASAPGTGSEFSFPLPTQSSS